MKRIIACLLICLSLFGTLSGCTSEEALLTSPFIMIVYPTYKNGAFVHTYPQKVYDNDKLFNALNAATASKPFEVDNPSIVYIIEMVNGTDYTTYDIWNDGTVAMSYNLFFGDVFYLNTEQYKTLVDIIES